MTDQVEMFRMNTGRKTGNNKTTQKPNSNYMIRGRHKHTRTDRQTHSNTDQNHNSTLSSIDLTDKFRDSDGFGRMLPCWIKNELKDKNWSRPKYKTTGDLILHFENSIPIHKCTNMANSISTWLYN